MESNKLKLSKREFVKWAEFFDWELGQRTKQENYLARLVYLIERQVFKDPAEMKDCFCPPLSEKELKMVNNEIDPEDSDVLDPISGWATLDAIFGKKE